MLSLFSLVWLKQSWPKVGDANLKTTISPIKAKTKMLCLWFLVYLQKSENYKKLITCAGYLSMTGPTISFLLLHFEKFTSHFFVSPCYRSNSNSSCFIYDSVYTRSLSCPLCSLGFVREVSVVITVLLSFTVCTQERSEAVALLVSENNFTNNIGHDVKTISLQS